MRLPHAKSLVRLSRELTITGRNGVNSCYVNRNCPAMLLLGILLQIKGGLGEVGRAAEVAPVVVVGAEGDDFLAFGG